VSLVGLPVLISDGAWPFPTSRELLVAREQAAAILSAAGARVERRPMPHLRRAVELYITTLARTSADTVRDVLREAGCDPVGIRAMLRRGGPHTVATRILLVAEWFEGRMPSGRAGRLVAAGRALSAELAATIGDGVLLHPPLATVAPRHGRTIGRPWWINHAALFNLAVVPVTQVPLGLGRDLLPLGVQVAAAPGNDHVSIAVAMELERAFGGWTPPGGHDGATAGRPRRAQPPRAAGPRTERPGRASVRVPSRTVNTPPTRTKGMPSGVRRGSA
jgi:fatty acid amide hydrolase 2